MILDESKNKAEDDFIIKMKEQVNLKEKIKTFSEFSICDEVLMYVDRVVMPLFTSKKDFEGFLFMTPRNFVYEISNEELYILVPDGS